MALPFLLQQLLISIPVLLVVSFYVRLWRSRNPMGPWDLPVVGILPFFISKFHNLHHELTVTLAGSGCNFKAHGPLGSGMRLFITSDPANVQHIFTSNHANYPKGEELAEIFDIVRGSIFTIDGEACHQHRAMFRSILSNPRVLEFMSRCCRDKVVNGLLPFLTRMESTRTLFDMQDLMARLIFDLTATPIFGVDPCCLSTNLPSMHVSAAMDTVMEVGLLRHVVPASCWKIMRRINFGTERKLAVAHTLLHGFITEMMENRKASCSDPDVLAAVDILSGDPAFSSDEALLSKILINYMIAGRDTVGTTLPWVFYNLAKNPRVVSSIREEMEAHIASLKKASAAVSSAASNMVFFESEETKDLVYLQAALFESLRLYPPGPFERKSVLADDVLPSGHQLYSGETILVSIYSMGRMEGLWGKECHEYKPERWLSEDGGKLRYVPSHKFLAFNSGPRMCLGKDIAIRQMKTIVAAVIWNFDLELLEGQSIEPKMSCILKMKNGLKMKIKKREGHDLE